LVLLGLVSCGTTTEEAAGGADGTSTAAGADAGVLGSGDGQVSDTTMNDATTAGDVVVLVDAAKGAALDSLASSTPDAVANSAVDVVAAGDTTAAGCPGKCAWNELCKEKKCTKVVKPCNGNCADDEYCDQGAGPPGLCTKSACSLPMTFGPHVQKVSEFIIAASNQGCDLDADGKPNNSLGNLLKVYPKANPDLLKATQEGTFILLFESADFNTGGAKFQIAALVGDLDASNLTCSPTSSFSNCKYTVGDENYQPAASGTCPLQVLIDPASGKICGVITEYDLNNAIEKVPDSGWQEIGLTKEQIKTLLPLFVKPDIDTNDDKIADAISIAMLFKTVPGKITAVVP
jgi:hypothetical protein